MPERRQGRLPAGAEGISRTISRTHLLKCTNPYFFFTAQIAKQEEVEVDFNPEFIARLIPRLNWEAVCTSAQLIGCANQLPAEVPEDAPANEEFLQRLHHVLMEVDITEGTMECPETGRQFPILNGIPNMLLEEFEV